MRLLQRRPLTPALLIPALLLLPTACGGGGPGGTPTGSGTQLAQVDVLIQDAPVDDLAGFSAVINTVRLRLPGGGYTNNMLYAPLSEDLLCLQGVLSWLTSQDMAAGTYDAVRIAFQSFSYEAVLEDGSKVDVQAASDLLVLEFAAPLVLAGGDYARIEIDVDLEAALEDLGGGVLGFTPQGSVLVGDGSSDAAVEHLSGVVYAAYPSEHRIELLAYADQDLAVQLAGIDVVLEPGAHLMEVPGGPYADEAAFFADLVPLKTELKVLGQLGADGVLTAKKVTVWDHPGVGSPPVVLRGLVRDLEPNGFDLAIVEIEKGADTVLPVLAGLGFPSAIAISHSMDTVFLGPGGQPGSAADLAVGQEVRVSFLDFQAPPFPAAVIEIEDEEVEFDGTIVSVDDLPDSVLISLEAYEPVVGAGLVSPPDATVKVLLAGAGIELDLSGTPELQPEQLQVLQKVSVRGSLLDQPSYTIDASTVTVRPGYLIKGEVVAVDSVASTLDTSSQQIVQGFGVKVGPGPLQVVLDLEASYLQDAASAAELYQLFETAPADHHLDIKVKGLGTDEVQEVRAYEVKAKLKKN